MISSTTLNRHNKWDGECAVDSSVNAIVCKPDVTVRRVLFHEALPGNIVDKTMYVLPFDDEITLNMSEEELNDYIGNNNNYGIVPMRFKKNPFNHWLAPFVTGHKYYVKYENILNIE